MVEYKLGDLKCRVVDPKFARAFICKYHYSKNCPTSLLMAVGEYVGETLVNCIVFNHPAMNGMSQMIWKGGNDSNTIELARMVSLEPKPKNMETFCIKRALKLLKEMYPKYKICVSYADNAMGHHGYCYQASNFKYYGYEKSYFFQNIIANEIYFQTILTNTSRPYGLVKSNSDLCQGHLKVFITKSYRYIYLLDKKVKLKFREMLYPRYNKGVDYIDIEDVISDGFYKNSIFRAWLLSRFESEIDNSTYYIATYILDKFDEEDIIKSIDKQLENKTMKEQYNRTLWYSNLIKKKDYIELLKQDSLNKKVGVVCENL